MSRRTALLVVVPLALALSGMSVGAGAYVAQTIGKNLVVTKSIKNGAVTSAKIKPGAVDGSLVKNGSLTAVDLAPGTIPQPLSKSVMAASISSTFPDANVFEHYYASGVSDDLAEWELVAPVDMTVSNLTVRLATEQGPGQARKVSLFGRLPDGANFELLKCTVVAGSRTCQSSGTGVIPAGARFYMIYVNDATSGSVAGPMMSSFVVTLS